eukprot:650277-Prymnesium_polylepis.1
MNSREYSLIKSSQVNGLLADGSTRRRTARIDNTAPRNVCAPSWPRASRARAIPAPRHPVRSRFQCERAAF